MPEHSQKLLVQDPAPTRRCGTERTTGHQGQEGGNDNENRVRNVRKDGYVDENEGGNEGKNGSGNRSGNRDEHRYEGQETS